MSKLTEYSKFDHLRDDDDNDDDDDDEEQPTTVEPTQLQLQQQQQSVHSSSSSQETSLAITTRDPITNRYIFSYNHIKVYEWEQTLDEVNMYIPTPSSTSSTTTRAAAASDFHIIIAPKHLSVGLRGHDRLFLNEPTYSLVQVSESSWYLDHDNNNNNNSTLCIVLVKGHRGETWESPLRGTEASSAASAALKEEMKKDMLLERFQEEHPGMDFRGAEVNGAVPDPRTFMGGLGAG